MMKRLLTLLLICHLGLPAWAEKTPSRQDLHKLQQQIQQTQARINKSQGEQGRLQQQLRSTELQLGKVKADIYQLQNSLKQQQQQLDELQQQQRELEQQKQQQEAIIIEQINASYRLGREKKIKVLLNQEDPQKLSRSLIYTDYFNKARIEAIQAYQHTIQQLDEIKPGIEKTSVELLANKEQLVNKQKELKASYQARSQALAKVNESIKSDQRKISKLNQDKSELEELLRAVEVAIENIKLPSDSIPFAKTKGKLRWPVQGNLDKRFGRKREPGNLRWEGVAFYNAEGTDVHAVHHGRVVFADWFRGKGLLMIIDHGNGYMTLYAHNQSLLREAGDWVSAGETIATLGDSGGLDHPELYFEIRHQGTPLNPKLWLNRHG